MFRGKEIKCKEQDVEKGCAEKSLRGWFKWNTPGWAGDSNVTPQHPQQHKHFMVHNNGISYIASFPPLSPSHSYEKRNQKSLRPEFKALCLLPCSPALGSPPFGLSLLYQRIMIIPPDHHQESQFLRFQFGTRY